jgi:hypothetical protein
MQRFGRGARTAQLKGVCTLILEKKWRSFEQVTGEPDTRYIAPNATIRKFQYAEKNEPLWNWLMAPCLRQGFLELLDVPEQYDSSKYPPASVAVVVHSDYCKITNPQLLHGVFSTLPTRNLRRSVARQLQRRLLWIENGRHMQYTKKKALKL